MKPSERIIAEIHDLKEETAKQFQSVNKKIDALNGFRMKFYGGLAVITFLISLGLEAVARSR